jgi:hypothetical protein
LVSGLRFVPVTSWMRSRSVNNNIQCFYDHYYRCKSIVAKLIVLEIKQCIESEITHTCNEFNENTNLCVKTVSFISDYPNSVCNTVEWSISGVGTQGNPCIQSIFWFIMYPHLLYSACSPIPLMKYSILHKGISSQLLGSMQCVPKRWNLNSAKVTHSQRICDAVSIFLIAHIVFLPQIQVSVIPFEEVVAF